MERQITVTLPERPPATVTMLTERTDVTETTLVQLGLRTWFPKGLPDGTKVTVTDVTPPTRDRPRTLRTEGSNT